MIQHRIYDKNHLAMGFPENPFGDWLEQHRRIMDQLRLADQLRFADQLRIAGIQADVDRLRDAMRSMREMEAYRLQFQAAQSVFVDQLSLNWTAVHEQLVEDARRIRDLYGPTLHSLGSAAQRVQEIAEAVRASSLSWIGPADVVTKELMDRFAIQVGDRLNALDLEEEVELDDVLAISSEEFDRLPQLDRARIDWKFVVSLAIALYFGLWAMAAARTTTDEFDTLDATVRDAAERQDEALEELGATVRELVTLTTIAPHLAAGIDETHVLMRSRHLRTGPSARDESIAVLPAGSEAQLLRVSEGWAAVLVRTDGEGGFVVGWVDARYLKPVER